MSKRRRTSSIASRGQEDDSLDEASTSSGPTVRKRSKKQDPVRAVVFQSLICLCVILFYSQNCVNNFTIP